MKITKTNLQQLIWEELAKLTEARELPGRGDWPGHGPKEPDYEGGPEMSPDEEAIVAADQMIDTFVQGRFDIKLDDALAAMGTALEQRAARAHRLEEKTEE